MFLLVMFQVTHHTDCKHVRGQVDQWTAMADGGRNRPSRVLYRWFSMLLLLCILVFWVVHLCCNLLASG